MARATLRGLAKRYGDAAALADFELSLEDGELVAVLGPSGCGKSTLLRLIAGLEKPDAGEMLLDGRRIDALRPGDRDVAMVFQSYALYPHMTVRQNIGYGMKVRGVPEAERNRLIDEAARILGLQALLERRPKQLSGGQRQRVAIGRAIVRQPDVFLFDEPLSNLDAKLRIEMRSEIKQLHRRLENTVVYVTHDQVEAMTLADRVVVMHQGRIEQAAPPLELYEHPANAFVAAFIGAPSMNFVPAQVAPDAASLYLDGGAHLPLPARLGNQLGRKVILGVRPEHILPAANGEGLMLQVREIEPLGPHQLAIGELAGTRFVAQLPPHLPLAIGRPCPIAVDRARIHLFDPETGRAI